MSITKTLPALLTALAALQGVLGDYAPATCADFGGCYDPSGWAVTRDMCNSAIDQVCGSDLSKTNEMKALGSGGGNAGNCVVSYALEDIKGPRVGSKQDCINTFNSILDACGPKGGPSQGFWGTVQSGNSPGFDIYTATHSQDKANVCEGKGRDPAGTINTGAKSTESSGGKFGVLAGSHPKRSFMARREATLANSAKFRDGAAEPSVEDVPSSVFNLPPTGP